MKPLLFCLSLFAATLSLTAADVTVSSPDGNLVLTIQTDGALTYTLASGGIQLIAPSPMG